MCWDIFRWAKEVIFDPAKSTRKDYKYGEFVKRLAVVSLVTGVLKTLLIVLALNIFLPLRGDLSALVSVFITIPLYLFVAAFAPFVSAAVTQFFGKIVFGLMKKDYKKTYNAYAYAAVPGFLFGWIPVVGEVVGGIWGIVVAVYALANQQKIPKGRALLVILIPIFIAVVVFLLIAIAAASFIAGTLFGPAMMKGLLGMTTLG